MAKARTAKAEKILMVHTGGLEEEEEAASPTKGLPLFAGEDQITGIAVYRTEPIEEGSVGNVPADADEETIRRRWGGGIYKITAKGIDGKFKGTRTITIGGDPKFESLDAKKRYKSKLAGLDEVPTPAPPAAPPAMAIPEILALVSQSHAQQMEMMRLQMAAQKIEADDRERRNRIEADEREARARREAEESRERDRTFNATMVSMMKSDAKVAASSPMELVTVLLQGLKLGKQMGDGAGDSGPTDPLTTLMANLPGILEHGGRLVQAGAAQAPGAAQVAAVPPGIRITGPVASKLKAAVEGLLGKGYSQDQALIIADAALGAGVEALATVPNAPTRPDPAAAPGAPPPPAPQRTAARKATAVRPRATPRR